MNTGKVKFYNTEKMFGFIIDDKTGQENFVHKTGLIDQIKENDAVEYDLVPGKKGLNCVDVKRVS